MTKTEINKKQVVIDNINLLEVNDLYKEVTELLIRKEVKVDPTDKNFFGSIGNHDNLFDFEESLDWNKERFDEFLKQNDISKEEFYILYENNSLFYYYFFQATEKSFSISGDNLLNLILFLRFVTTGIQDDNFHESYKIHDSKIIIKETYLDLPFVKESTLHNEYKQGKKVEICGLTVKQFQNGRLDITGDNAVIEKIKSYIKLAEKHRHWKHPRRSYDSFTSQGFTEKWQ